MISLISKKILDDQFPGVEIHSVADVIEIDPL